MAEESRNLSKSDLKEDQFLEWVLEAVEYVKERRQYFIGGVVVIILAVVGVNLLIDQQEQAKVEASQLLGQILIAEEEGRAEEGMSMAQRLVDEYAGTPAAAKGVLLLANRYYNQQRYEEARSLYQGYLDSYEPVDVLVFGAWNGLAACLAAEEKWDQAAAKYQQYAQTHSGTQQSAYALWQAAQCYKAMGNTQQQKALLEQIIRDYAESPLVSRAREEQNML
ncbi:MAG: tetratricopeptide repeat protein [Candidatus Latescibacteria bacterium]|nr:tetratricopeptide repeat protein [Candidatus Latescibacterota bacterium]